jgi:hypothetical protein
VEIWRDYLTLETAAWKISAYEAPERRTASSAGTLEFGRSGGFALKGAS